MVRPSAGTDGPPIASLKNGDKIQIVSSAGNGWYQITFSGPGGADVTRLHEGRLLDQQLIAYTAFPGAERRECIF